MIELDETFGVEQTEWYENAESVMSPLIEKSKKKKWLPICQSNSASGNIND